MASGWHQRSPRAPQTPTPGSAGCAALLRQYSAYADDALAGKQAPLLYACRMAAAYVMPTAHAPQATGQKVLCIVSCMAGREHLNLQRPTLPCRPTHLPCCRRADVPAPAAPAAQPLHAHAHALGSLAAVHDASYVTMPPIVQSSSLLLLAYLADAACTRAYLVYTVYLPMINM